MLRVMQTPAHERVRIEVYLRSQFGEGFAVEHVEKLASEQVLGQQYDVWDAHTSQGRWWVITNPVNLYSQDQVKSMDVALSLHIGLMSRVMARQPLPAAREGAWALEVLRRLDVAGQSLERAREVEDFQAVGMRLRETLLTLGTKLAEQGYRADAGATDPQRGNFKAWASVCAESIAAGVSAEHLRGLLKALGEKTWNYVAWLTHARAAGRLDAQIALSAVGQTVDAFLAAVDRHQLGAPARCLVCASYQMRIEVADDTWVRVCETCGWEGPAQPAEHHDPAGEDTEDDVGDQRAPEGDCIVLRDLRIYLSPDQARAMLDRAAAESRQQPWANPFTFFIPEQAVLGDAHRISYVMDGHAPTAGAELAYACAQDACVNPAHAQEIPLPDEAHWMCGIVEHVICHPGHLELGLSMPGVASRTVFVDRAILDHYGLGDAGGLAERVVFFTQPDEQGWVQLFPVQRRVDYAHATGAPGWLHPAHAVTRDQPCPCGSGQPYDTCHGEPVTPQAAP